MGQVFNLEPILYNTSCTTRLLKTLTAVRSLDRGDFLNGPRRGPKKIHVL